MASFDLQKKAHKVSDILLTKGITSAPVMRVGLALDISGSMSSLYRSSNGQPSAVQNAFNQLMGVAVKFDDNGELDVFKFDDRCEYVGTSKPEEGDYDRFIENNRISVRGGTNYTPIINEAMNFFFGSSTPNAGAPKKGLFGGLFGKADPAPSSTASADPSNDIPVLMLIVTDGEPFDKVEVERRMRATVNQPIYFHMVGINGNRRNFPTIAHLADELPNVGEVYLPRLDMSDQEIYSQLICDELIDFVKKFASGSTQAASA